MAHNMKIDEATGRAMFAATEKAGWWDTMGANLFDTIADFRDLMVKAGLLWKVAVRQACYVDAIGNIININDRFQVVREDYDENGEFITSYPFREVSTRFEPVQISEVFEMMQDLVEEYGYKWHTGGAVGDGEYVFGTLKGESYQIGKSHHESFLNGSIGYGGLSPIRIGNGNHRIECNNTLTFWHDDLERGKNEHFSVRQTTNVGERLAEIRLAISAMKQNELTIKDKLRFLATKKITQENAKNALFHIMGLDSEEKIKKASPQATKRQERLLEIWLANESNLPSTEIMTQYGLLNAVTYLTSHEYKGRKTGNFTQDDAIARSQMVGTAQQLGQKAFDYLVELQPDGTQTLIEQTYFDFGASHIREEKRELSFGADLDAILSQGISL